MAWFSSVLAIKVGILQQCPRISPAGTMLRDLKIHNHTGFNLEEEGNERERIGNDSHWKRINVKIFLSDTLA